MFGLFETKRSEHQKRTRFSHGNVFAISAPASWRQDVSGDSFSLSTPDGAALTGSAYGKAGGSFEDFVQHRFASVQDFYAQVGTERRLNQNGAAFITREYEGVWPGETSVTYYAVTCIELQSMYVSLTVTTSPDDYKTRRQLYESVVSSLEAAYQRVGDRRQRAALPRLLQRGTTRTIRTSPSLQRRW